ncbi:hypothetical protein EBS43_00715 [bacterium]|nr:hypothetical protein [bacterium]
MPIQKKSKAKTKQKKNKVDKKNKTQDLLLQIQLLEKEISLAIGTLEEKLSQLECLNQFSGQMSATLDLGEIREQAIEATCKIVGCQSAVLLWVDQKKGELFYKHSSESANDGPLVEVRIPIDDQTLAGCVAMSGECILMNHFQKDPRAQASRNYHL